MREIKFRGKQGGSWCYAPSMEFTLGEFFQFVDAKLFDPATVGQWTGLKDKNGVDIYEGDRLQWNTYTAFRRWWSRTEEIPIIEEEVRKQREDVSVDSGVVKFDDGEFCTTYPITPRDIKRGERYTSGAGNGGDVESKYWGFEVIGNIHEVTI